MSRFRNRLAKRVMAVILSGAMVMSNMTAFASEAPKDTGGYSSEMEDVGRQEDADMETAEKEDAVDNKSTNVSSKEETTSKDEDNVSSDKKDDNGNAEDTAKENVVARKADTKDDNEDMEIAEEDDNDEEVKAGVTGEWNFKSGSKYFTTGNIVDITEGQTGEVDGLKIDNTETVNGSRGKFTTAGRTDWIQANTGTKITIPVEGASKITTTWSNAETYTIDGYEGTKTDICKGENNEAVIVITSGGYLGSIKVEALDMVKISGDVTLPSGAPSGIKVIFTEKTDRASKFTVEADITDGKYETELCCTGEQYEISLSSNKYSITDPTNTVINVAKNENGISQSITATALDTAETVGTVTFPAGVDKPSDLKLTFTEDGGTHIVKDVAVTTTEGENSYTAELQAEKHIL